MPKAKPLYGAGDDHVTHDQLRRGPWTLEEDNLLIEYISIHGEGRWNSLAQLSGLKRTGKSCRLRWLNYLKPDIKRGNLTPHEQLLILELHSKWGNRWSKIAQNLPGRTDNEIKNYWRTRVQKQARQLNIDSNSNKFLEAIRTFWMPRLLEKMEQESSCITTSSPSPTSSVLNHVPVPSIPGDQTVKMDCNNSSNNNSHEIPGYFTPDQDYGTNVTCGKLLDKDCFYHVGAPTRYEMQQVDAQEDAYGLPGCHVSDADRFVEDLSNIFWSFDEEFWQLKKPGDFGI